MKERFFMSIILSIIVPMYNVEPYINRCIESLLNQTFTYTEIIIVDDGSTDLSLTNVLEYQKKHSDKIKLYSQTNKGQSSARNLGLSKAIGKYVAFVDADDFIDKNMYSEMLLYAEENDLDIIQCNYLNWYGDGSKKNHVYKFDINQKEIYTGKEYYEKEPSLSPCDKVFKRSFLSNMNFYFEEGRYAEDVLEISKAYFYAQRVMYINEVFYFYRRESMNSTRNSTTLNKSIKLSVDKVYIAYKLNIFCKTNYWDGVVRRIIIRNILGSILQKRITNKYFRQAVLNEHRTRNSLAIMLSQMKVSDIISYTKIGISKFLGR